MSNVDHAEIAKFEALAHRWWDRESEFKPLHDINPLRVNWIDEHAGLAGKKVLDVGCGGGETIHQMLGKSEGSVIDGVDYAKTSLKISSKVNAHELGKRVFLHRADVAKLPFDDDVFDLVTAMETTYFWPDILAAFSEIRRVLKKGGLFAIILEAVTPGIHDDWSIPGVDIRIRSADEIRELLVKAGFSSVSVHRGEEDSAVILAIEAEE